jgi:WD40 repeat protein
VKNLALALMSLTLAGCSTLAVSSRNFEFVREVQVDVCRTEYACKPYFALSDDGEQFIVGLDRVSVVDIGSGVVRPLNPDSELMTRVQQIEMLSDDRAIIVSNFDSEFISIVRLQTGEIESAYFWEHARHLVHLDVTSDRQTAFILDSNGLAALDLSTSLDTQIYRVSDEETPLNLLVDNSYEITVFPDGQRVFLTGEDMSGVVSLDPVELVWSENISNGEDDVWDDEASYSRTALSDNGELIFALEREDNSRLLVFDSSSGDEIKAFDVSALENVYISGVVSMEQAEKVLAFNNVTAFIWDAASLTELQRLSGHFGSVYGVAVSRDGNTVASIDESQTIRVYRRN